MNVEAGDISRTWLSLAAKKAEIATMPSPPGWFSTTTGWPHFFASRSANSREPMSTPDPGPSGTMNLTVRVGQLCACAGALNMSTHKVKAAAETRAKFFIVITASSQAGELGLPIEIRDYTIAAQMPLPVLRCPDRPRTMDA